MHNYTTTNIPACMPTATNVNNHARRSPDTLPTLMDSPESQPVCGGGMGALGRLSCCGYTAPIPAPDRLRGAPQRHLASIISHRR